MKVTIAVLLCFLILYYVLTAAEMLPIATDGMLPTTESAGLTVKLDEDLLKNEEEVDQTTEESKTTLRSTEILTTELLSDKNVQIAEGFTGLSTDSETSTIENRQMSVETSETSKVSYLTESTESTTISETDVKEESNPDTPSTKKSESTAIPGSVYVETSTETKTSSTEMEALPEYLQQRYQKLHDKLQKLIQNCNDKMGCMGGPDMENRLLEILQFYHEAIKYLL
ncbi:hypothetical protein Aperf_G00000058599 [Anoplocephala perfoliata]